MLHRGIVALLVLFVCAVPALAQDAAAKEKKVRELLALSGAADQGKLIMDQMIEQFRGRGAPDAFLDRFKALAKPEDLIDLIVPIYLKHFDEPTLDAAIAFFKSPAGRKFVAAQPRITKEAFDVGLKWGQDMARKAMAGEPLGDDEAKKTEDMNSLRNLVGLLASTRQMPMKDGRVDPYAFVRNGDIQERHFFVFKSARAGVGPTKKEILAGDYKNFPYERFKGVIKAGVAQPLLWERKADTKNGRLVAWSNGAVRYHKESELQEILRKHGQLPAK